MTSQVEVNIGIVTDNETSFSEVVNLSCKLALGMELNPFQNFDFFYSLGLYFREKFSSGIKFVSHQVTGISLCLTIVYLLFDAPNLWRCVG